MNAAKTMHRRLPRLLFAVLLPVGLALPLAPTPARGQEAGDRLAGFWIDDNLEKGLLQARETEKPLLIVFRCPP